MSKQKNYLSDFEEQASEILQNNIPSREGEIGSIRYVVGHKKNLLEKMRIVESQIMESANGLLNEAKSKISEQEFKSLKESITQSAREYMEKFIKDNS